MSLALMDGCSSILASIPCEQYQKNNISLVRSKPFAYLEQLHHDCILQYEK